MSDELRPVWQDWSNGTVKPTARLQERVYWDGEIVTEFCVQLEYNVAVHYEMDQSSWRAVARFDHNVSPHRGHDIRDEGLHMDLFPKTDVEREVKGFPAVALRDAPDYCRRFLEERYEHYLGRYERVCSVEPENQFYG